MTIAIVSNHDLLKNLIEKPKNKKVIQSVKKKQ